MVSRTADLYFPRHRQDVFKAVEESIPKKIDPMMDDLYFPSHKKQVFDAIDKATMLFNHSIDIIVDYLINPHDDVFGAQQWFKYFYVEIRENKIDKRFYSIWFGPDPVYPYKRVFETHLPPVFRPQFMKFPYEGCVKFCSLEVFQEMGWQLGYKSDFPDEDPTIRQNKKNQVNDGCWLLFRKNVVGRNMTYEDQLSLIKSINEKCIVKYEQSPSLIDLTCIVFTRFRTTAQKHLGGKDGEEGMVTFSRCRETTMHGSEKDKYPSQVGGFERRGLGFPPVIYGSLPSEETGIALVMKL